MKNLFFIILVLFLYSCEKPSLKDVNPITGNRQDGSSTEEDPWTQEYMTLVNGHRESLGFGDLRHNSGMAQIALEHSQDMANGSVAFGHTGFSERCSQVEVVMGRGNLCGEIVAEGQKTPQAAFDAWMNSPAHRAEIEQGRYTDTGFAYAIAPNGTIYWTEIFIEE